MAYTKRETALLKAMCGYDFASSNFDNFRDDKEIVLLGLTRIKSDGGCLYYVSERLRDDEEVVLKAIEVDAEGIRLASDRWRDNKEMVAKAIGYWWWSITWASDRLKADKELVLMALKGGQEKHKNDTYHRYVARDYIKQFMDVSLMVDPEVVKNAISLNYQFMEFAPYFLKSDPKFILPLCQEIPDVRHKGSLIYYCSENIKSFFKEDKVEKWGREGRVGERCEELLSKLILTDELNTTLKNKPETAPKKLKI